MIYILWLSDWDACDGVVSVTIWDEFEAERRWEESLLVGGLCNDEERLRRCHRQMSLYAFPYDSEGIVLRCFDDLSYNGHYVSLLYGFPMLSHLDLDVGNELFFIWTSERSKKWFSRGGVLAWATNAKEAMQKAIGLCFLLCGKKPVPNVHYSKKDANDFEYGGEYLQIALKSNQNLVVQRCFITDGDVTGEHLIEPINTRKCGPYNGHMARGCVPLFEVDEPAWKTKQEELKRVTESMITLVLCLKHLGLLRPLRMIIACQAYQDRLGTMWDFE